MSKVCVQIPPPYLFTCKYLYIPTIISLLRFAYANSHEGGVNYMAKCGRKPGLVKTKTIKKRKLEVYFSTEEEKKELLSEAEKSGVSSSKFILSCIQERRTGGTTGPITMEFAVANNEIKKLNAQIENLIKEKEQLLILVGRNAVEIELLNTRDTPVRHEVPNKEGVQKINKQLVDILRNKRVITGIELIETLKIDPRKKDAGQKLWKDFEVLVGQGLVEQTETGWRWLGR